MQGSKLIELIQTLSQEEIKAFGSFLEGESYRKTSAIFELYQYLKKYHPIFPEKKITKELVYKKIMPAGKAYNNKRMRDMMSILSLNLEHFLLKKELEENEIEKEFLMLNILKKRNLDKLYFQKIKQLQKKWEKNRPNGIEQYYNEYRLLHHLYYHPNVSVYSEMEIALGDLIGKLDQYYFASKLYETIGHIRTQRMISYSKDKTSNVLIEEILENSNHHVFEENLYVNLYSKLLYAFNTGDYSNYADLKDLFFNNIEDFSEDEKKKIYIELQSFCTQNYRKGKSEFLGEIFQLNQLAIEQNIVLDNGRIPNGLYRNIVIIGTAVKEFEWTENFINEYKVYLEDDKKGDVVTLCEASLEFSKGNFETTLTKLALVKYQDILYALHVRNLQLQCYYEMDNYEESFYNSTNALSAFLSRNQVLGPMVKEASLNFLKYIKKLQTQKVGLKQNVEGYIADLEQAHNVSNKKWLLEKAQELV